MHEQTSGAENARQTKQLATLERLLSIEATAVKPALTEANTFIAEAISADKVEAALYDPAIESLVAVGASQTPLSQREVQLGLDRFPLANGGRVVEVFQTGVLHQNGQVQDDEHELLGVRQALGVGSTIAVPLVLSDTKLGVFQVNWRQACAFNQDDVEFVRAVGQWIVLLLERAELVERLMRESVAQSRRLAAEELVLVLSHDFGNYLTPLIGHAFILHARAEQGGRADDLRTIEQLRNGLERLKRLTNDLLDVGRISGGIFGLQRQPVDLCALIEVTANAFQSTRIVVDFGALSELVVNVDPERIHQAVENLLNNALKHSPVDAAITLSLARQLNGLAQWAVIEVQDRGPGIAPSLLPHLMERFVKGPASKGLGLGLYLARNIAEAHGGSLTVESTVGLGTSFRLALPLHQE